jgi:hypothetical protein
MDFQTRNCQLIGETITDHRDLTASTRIALLSRSTQKVERLAPILSAANAERRQHRTQLQGISILLLYGSLNKADAILRSKRRVPAHEQARAKLVLRARVPGPCALLQ